jgi:NAD(P)H dehydrogenase (quinone)
MTIAITGATGQLGRLTLAALQAKGATAIALARDPARATDLAAQVRAFDYRAPDPAALRGVTTLALISSNSFDDRAADHARAIDAAKQAGVGRIVYTSILRGPASPMALAADHIATETALAASGIPHTILRNGWYTENYTGSLAAALAHGALIGAAGDGLISSAARADYAQALAHVALTEGHDGQTYELAGDTAHTMADLAAEVSRLAGRPISYQSLPQDTYAGILASFGLPPAFAALLADADACAATGALHDDSRTLSRLIGRPTTPMPDTIASAMAAL